MELKRLCYDANEIESGIEIDDNDAFVCEVTDESVQSRLYGAPPGWSPPCAPDGLYSWTILVYSVDYATITLQL